MVRKIAKKLKKLGFGIIEYKINFEEVVNDYPTITIKIGAKAFKKEKETKANQPLKI